MFTDLVATADQYIVSFFPNTEFSKKRDSACRAMLSLFCNIDSVPHQHSSALSKHFYIVLQALLALCVYLNLRQTATNSYRLARFGMLFVRKINIDSMVCIAEKRHPIWLKI